MLCSVALCDKRLALSRDLIDPTFTEGKLPKAPSHWPAQGSREPYFLRGICNNHCFYRVNIALFRKSCQNQPKKCRPHRVFHFGASGCSFATLLGASWGSFWVSWSTPGGLLGASGPHFHLFSHLRSSFSGSVAGLGRSPLEIRPRSPCGSLRGRERSDLRLRR